MRRGRIRRKLDVSLCRRSHASGLDQRIELARRSLGLFFFFQAEDGIRDLTVTGVQTCALPICHREDAYAAVQRNAMAVIEQGGNFGERLKADKDVTAKLKPAEIEALLDHKIGRASCRERV